MIFKTLLVVLVSVFLLAPTAESCPRCPNRNLSSHRLLESCTDGHYVDSKCTYRCSSGYLHFVIGRSTSTCESNYVWSSPLPYCWSFGRRRRSPQLPEETCTPIDGFPNGDVNCTNDNRVKSVCTFRCKNGYAFLPGSDETCTCNELGDWSAPPPKCVKNSQKSVKGGAVTKFGEKK